MQWIGTNTTWADGDWLPVTNGAAHYRDYYDLDGTNITTQPSGGGIVAPEASNQGGASIDLHESGGRLAMTVIRNGSLWTCQVVGLSGTNGFYLGDESGSNVDRSAIQWLKLNVDAVGGLLGYSAHGRIYDSASTSPFYYYFPSLMVNCAGDMAIGFSGSSVTNYIGAFYSWRLANGTMLNKPRLIRAGVTTFKDRWGDYSATTLDPTDDWSFWTVQEYADPAGDPGGVGFPWETVVARIKAGP